MSISQSSRVYRFRDSERVLKDIAEVLEHHNGVIATLREDGGTGLAGAVNKENENIVTYISEVIEDAAKTEIVPNKSTRS